MGQSSVLDQMVREAKADGQGVSSPELRRPLVSLIVTNYNYARFVEDCLRSICAQTYQDIECLIVDDVSTDDSVEVIERFIASTPEASKFELLKLETNGGQMNAFIEGFHRSKGAFVVFVDADDFLFPEFVETHLKAHLNQRYAAALTCSNEVVVDQSGQVLSAGLEKWAWPKDTVQSLAADVPVPVQMLEGWQSVVSLSGKTSLDSRPAPLIFVGPDANPLLSWIWSTTSGTMFRRGVLDAVLVDDLRDLRICADFFVFQFGHLLGGSLLISTPLGAYRRHGANNFAASASVGAGTLRGVVRSDVDFGDLVARMSRAIVDDYARYVSTIGEPRVLRILAGITSARRLLPIYRAIGWSRPGMQLQFTLLYLIRSTRRRSGQIARKLRFA